VKTAANAFLATKISFINAMAEVCERTGADVTELAQALSHDERIGGRFLRPGLGFGGGCLPKDIRAFAHRAAELGVGKSLTFLHQVDDINIRRRERTTQLAQDLVGGRLAGLRVAAFGAAFKPNSDDIRDAPALDVAHRLWRLGATVALFDPQAMDNARRVHPELEYAESAFAAARDADLVVLLTEWEEFRQIEPNALGEVVRHRRILDGRHALDRARYRAAGWQYRALGRR
jgi:UDPglucose 6-dehydrogenase